MKEILTKNMSFQRNRLHGHGFEFESTKSFNSEKMLEDYILKPEKPCTGRYYVTIEKVDKNYKRSEIIDLGSVEADMGGLDLYLVTNYAIRLVQFHMDGVIGDFFLAPMKEKVDDRGVSCTLAAACVDDRMCCINIKYKDNSGDNDIDLKEF